MLFFWMKVFHADTSVSLLMLMTTSGWSAKVFPILWISGNDSRHGPHHVAQKSSSTTLPPISSSEICSPSLVVKVNAGAMRMVASRGFSRKCSTRVRYGSDILAMSRYFWNMVLASRSEEHTSELQSLRHL